MSPRQSRTHRTDKGDHTNHQHCHTHQVLPATHAGSDSSSVGRDGPLRQPGCGIVRRDSCGNPTKTEQIVEWRPRIETCECPRLVCPIHSVARWGLPIACLAMRGFLVRGRSRLDPKRQCPRLVGHRIYDLEAPGRLNLRPRRYEGGRPPCDCAEGTGETLKSSRGQLESHGCPLGKAASVLGTHTCSHGRVRQRGV